MQLSKQTVAELEKVVTSDVLGIERDELEITLYSMDPREEYFKPELVENIVEVKIGEEGRVNKIGSFLDHS